MFTAVYLIWQPRTVDLAAHTFRADLFGKEGFTIWNGQWYGGHHTPAYSVLSPPLAWLLGPPVALALAALASAALFPPLVRGWFGDERARWGAIWFGAATATLLFTSRLPFAIGVAFGLAALLALQRRHYWLAILFAVLCPLGSPVAGLFLAMAGVAYAIAERHDRPKRLEGLAIAAAAFFPPVFMSWAFPEGGWAPFPTSAYVPIPMFALACLIVLPREQSALRWGAALYGLGATLALALETPMGGNAVRLGALFGGPVLLCALWGRPWTKKIWVLPLLTAGFAALAFWQWSPAVRDVIKYLEDPAAKSDYFTPLKEFLFRLPDQRRIEIPFTRSHWEGSEVAMDQALARGWLRQLDTKLNPIFYREGLNRLTYASWLADNAVRYVALPSAKPDKSSYGERALIEKGLPYLRLRWKSDDWRVYEVLLPAPLVISQKRARIVLEQFQSDELLLDVKRPGEAIVKVRWTPYWFATHACVEPYGDWTKVIAQRGRASCTCRPGSHPNDWSRAAAAATTPRASRASYARRLVPRSHPLLVQLARVWRLSGRWLPNGWLDAIRQLALFAGAYYLYRIVRGIVDGQAEPRVRERAQPRGRRAGPRAVLRAGASGLGRGPGVAAHVRQLDVRELALRDHHDVPDLALHRPQPRLLLRAQHVPGGDGAGARGLHRLPDRAAALHARVGLQRLGGPVRRREGRPERERALQPVRRRAEHARGVRADDRHPGDHPRQAPRR